MSLIIELLAAGLLNNMHWKDDPDSNGL
jgi:hypothetical protein